MADVTISITSREWQCPCGKVLTRCCIDDLGDRVFNALVCTNECSHPWAAGTLPSLSIGVARERSARKRFDDK